MIWNNKFRILCNPAPITEYHFTVSHLFHKPQRLKPVFIYLLQLTKELGQNFTCLYNGPNCGASAPDHLHFQIIPGGFLPIEDEQPLEKNRIMDNRKIILLNNSNISDLLSDFEKLYSLLNKLYQNNNIEPMFNTISQFRRGKLTVLIFLREKHRPACYYYNDQRRLVISPGAIDMGGMMICSRYTDYLRLNRSTILNIYNEVSLNEKAYKAIVDKI